MSNDTMVQSRRTVLGSCLSAIAFGVAGCVGDSEETDDEPDERGEGPETLQAGNRVLNSSFPMEVYDPETDTRLVQIHWHGQRSNSHWHQQPLDVPLDRWETYEMRALDRDGEIIQLGEQQPLQLVMVRTEETPEDLLEKEIDGNMIDIRGRNPGRGEYSFRLVSGNQIEWESPLVQLRVE
ncbi:hypothetical protein [Halovenus sp. HT40]|uniref:hypothetical protein n=1 Tax=Halovenus sp. HT40 TaxID=3126691 RepID=UPI00300F2186